MSQIRLLLAVGGQEESVIADLLGEHISKFHPSLDIIWQHSCDPDLRSALVMLDEPSLLVCSSNHIPMILALDCDSIGCILLAKTKVIIIGEPREPRHVSRDRMYVPHVDHLPMMFDIALPSMALLG